MSTYSGKKQRPRAQEGHTSIISDDRGHLLPGVAKRGSAWTDFKGTWDLPARLPALSINPTGRSVEGLKRLRSWGLDPQQHSGSARSHGGSRNSDRLRDDEQSDAAVQQDGVVEQNGVAEQDRVALPAAEDHKDEQQDQ